MKDLLVPHPLKLRIRDHRTQTLVRQHRQTTTHSERKGNDSDPLNPGESPTLLSLSVAIRCLTSLSLLINVEEPPPLQTSPETVFCFILHVRYTRCILLRYNVH